MKSQIDIAGAHWELPRPVKREPLFPARQSVYDGPLFFGPDGDCPSCGYHVCACRKKRELLESKDRGFWPLKVHTSDGSVRFIRQRPVELRSSRFRPTRPAPARRVEMAMLRPAGIHALGKSLRGS